MKILLFGDSDTSGAFMRGRTWPELFCDEMESRRGEPVEMVQSGLAPAAPSALDYAERKVAETAPDLVILPVASYAFTASFVWVRVQRLFGRRAGKYFRRMEESFDQSTRHGGRFRTSLNATTRKLIRRVIGAEAMSTREAMTQSYVGLMRMLSKTESMEVVLFGYPGRGAHARTGNAPAERRRFFTDLREQAAQHRFGWADVDGAFDAVPQSVPVMTVDGLHYNEKGHEVFYDAMTAAFDAIGAGAGPED